MNDVIWTVVWLGIRLMAIMSGVLMWSLGFMKEALLTMVIGSLMVIGFVAYELTTKFLEERNKREFR